jgi:predicted RNA-binding Zn-ribbon protein involved in translation (DUF1610 family)
LDVPYWLVAAVLGIPPSIWAARWRRMRLSQRRALMRKCTACGYDLRATPDHCPECGMVPSAREVQSRL